MVVAVCAYGLSHPARTTPGVSPVLAAATAPGSHLTPEVEVAENPPARVQDLSAADGRAASLRVVKVLDCEAVAMAVGAAAADDGVVLAAAPPDIVELGFAVASPVAHQTAAAVVAAAPAEEVQRARLDQRERHAVTGVAKKW